MGNALQVCRCRLHSRSADCWSGRSASRGAGSRGAGTWVPRGAGSRNVRAQARSEDVQDVASLVPRGCFALTSYFIGFPS